jgi:hypothetical protein
MNRPLTGYLPGVDKRGFRFHATWTYEFIRDFGWGEYWRVVWRDTTIYRLKNWRCWFGHDLGPEVTDYEAGYRYETWRYCQRPNCEHCERTE